MPSPKAGGSVSTLVGTPGVSAFQDTPYYPNAPAPATFVDPVAIAATSGAILVADLNGIRVSINGETETEAGLVTQPAGYSDSSLYGGSLIGLLSGPQGVVGDGRNGFYIADTGNSAIRQCYPMGPQFANGLGGNWITSTVLGGPSQLSPVRRPSGIARDSQGDLFISDTATQQIIEFSNSGSVTAVAGNGTSGSSNGVGPKARFNGPYGIAVDGAGNLYVADTGKHTIRKGVPHAQIGFPTITGQPESQAVSSNSPATFSVVANGTGPMSYQWAFDGIDLPGEMSSTLTIPSAELINAGSYAVTVTNGGGVANSQAALLSVTVPSPLFSITGQPVSHNSSYSSSVAFTVNVGPATGASGRPAPFAVVSPTYQYQWFLNGSVLSDGGGISGSQSATLFLGSGSAESGAYNCLVSDGSGSVLSQAANLAVQPVAIPGRLVNVSCRRQVGIGANNLIAGFVVGGEGATSAEHILVRASGPALIPFGVSGTLADPTLQIFNTASGSTLLYSNSAWGGSPDISSTAAEAGAFAWTSPSSNDAGLSEVLPPGAYTANIFGASGDTGVALAEVYDSTPPSSFSSTSSRLINLSARSVVGTGSNVLIAGFVIGGSTAKTVLVRASGPALAQFGLSGTLADPVLELFGSNGAGASTPIQSNAGWGGSPQIASVAASVGAFSWGASGTPDSAILITLAPGAYTAEVSGASGDSGIALIEVYDIP